MQLKNPNLFKTDAYINGQWTSAEADRRFSVINPYNQEAITQVPDMGAKETKKAIEAAQEALPRWRAMTSTKRSRILRKWHDLIRTNTDDLAQILTIEQGKPFAEAKGEI